MANVVKNLIVIESKDCFVKFKNLILNDKGDVDFNKITPMPKDLNIKCNNFTDFIESNSEGNVLVDFKSILNDLEKQDNKEDTINDILKSIENYIRYGHQNWYSWSIKEWNTKWNSSNTVVDDAKHTIQFETAYNDVLKLILKLSEKPPNSRILYKYADEDVGYNVGDIEIMEGMFIRKNIKNGTKEAFDISLELFPEMRRYFKLKDNNYTYKYE